MNLPPLQALAEKEEVFYSKGALGKGSIGGVGKIWLLKHRNTSTEFYINVWHLLWQERLQPHYGSSWFPSRDM